jgi:hypothetical protein
LKIWEIFQQTNIIADFYLTGFEGMCSYSENANVVVLNQSEYLESIIGKYFNSTSGSFAIQPTMPTASAVDPSRSARILINETSNSTLANLRESFGNVTLSQSVPTVISGLPGYEFTYLIMSPTLLDVAKIDVLMYAVLNSSF